MLFDSGCCVERLCLQYVSCDKALDLTRHHRTGQQRAYLEDDSCRQIDKRCEPHVIQYPHTACRCGCC